jgi:hypothetical protein
MPLHERLGFAAWSGASLCVALVLTAGDDTGLRSHRTPEGAATGCEIHRTMVMLVSDTKALGYVNNTKFLVDAQGIGWLAVRSKNRGRYSIDLVHSVGPWREGMAFEHTWIEDRPGVEVSSEPQRPAAIAAGGDGAIHMVWYGGSNLDPSHQLRYARFGTVGGVRIEEETTPFTVPWPVPAAGGVDTTLGDLWQEHPSIAVGPGEILHVAWEARDGSRRSLDGTPRPGVAYATRTRDGRWSAAGVLARPSYLEVDDQYPSQSRPTILVDRSGTVHVLCYGMVGSVPQILHGEVKNGAFSGWKPIRPSAADQRHVAAALDPDGRLHAVWREGPVPGAGGAAGTVSIFYSALAPAGSWSTPVRVSGADESASTPSIAAGRWGVSVAWVGWTPGAANLEAQVENGFPSDNSTVEGALKIAMMRTGSTAFDSPSVVDPAPASYPSWATAATGGQDPPPLVWTSLDPSAAGSVRLFLGWCVARAH